MRISLLVSSVVFFFVFQVIAQTVTVPSVSQDVQSTTVVSTANQQVATQATAETRVMTDALQSEIETLKNSITELAERRGVLRSDLNVLQAQVEPLEVRASELQTAVTSLTSERAIREAEMTKIAQQKKKLQKDFDALKVKWQAITNRQKIREELQKNTFVKTICGDDVKSYTSLKGRKSKFLSPCEVELHYVGKPAAYFEPFRFIITKKDSVVVVYEKTLSDKENMINIRPVDWYSAEKIAVGEEYQMSVEYKGLEGASSYPLSLLYFTVTKKAIVFQVAPKLYTAWRHGENSDDTLLLPGVGVGGGYRLGNKADDRNVIALRGVFAFGPNLTSDNKRLQIVAGVEVVFSRYISIGTAWVVYGPDREARPLILLTYGDLYQAIVNVSKK